MAPTSYTHRVDVRVGAKTITNWTSYEISLDMLQPADSFSVEIGNPTREVYELVRPDEEVQILVDDTLVLTGFIDDRNVKAAPGGSSLSITGRDKGGRLVDEAAPLVKYSGLGIQQLAAAIASPWFESATMSNAANRRLVRGGRTIAKVSAEPPIFDEKADPRKVEPGQKRWDVLQAFLERANLLAWSTADGKQLVVGLPCYSQAPQFSFLHTRPGSMRSGEANVVEFTARESVGERYASLTVVGMARSDDPLAESQTRYVAARETVTTSGVFLRPKSLTIAADDIEDSKACRARAQYEMAIREGAGHAIELAVLGHGQAYRPNEPPALYAPDSMCLFEDEQFGIRGAYLITGATFRRDGNGTSSRLQLVPSGATIRV